MPVETPSLDWLAGEGTRFQNAFVQTPVCGPSRMSLYTGRYAHAHRSYWNDVPLPLRERTIAHYAREAGVRAALCGKTHHTPDIVMLNRLAEAGIKLPTEQVTNAGFEPWEVNEFWGEGWMKYLADKGYALSFDDPMVAAFLVENEKGERRNGWQFENARLPTIIREEDSDTAFMTRRAMEFIDDAGEDPWLLHLSYLKPHWPNVAPAPYNQLYDPSDSPAPVRHPTELEDPHPLLIPFREERRSLPFDQEQVWRENRATYFGLIRQIDDHLGRLFEFLRRKNRLDDTLIIFSSDHGEYMGDHWLFEKELFYESAIRVPLIIYDPSEDVTRGLVSDRFVESVDILPTCLEALGIDVPTVAQGNSLLPLLRDQHPEGWRKAVFGDWDFRFYHASERLGLEPSQCRAWMIRDHNYKYVRFNGLPDMLFDLKADPNEFINLAGDERYREVVHTYQECLLDWRQSTEDDSVGSQLMAQIGRSGVSWVPDHIP